MSRRAGSVGTRGRQPPWVTRPDFSPDLGKDETTPRLFGTTFARLALPGKVTAFLAETAHGRAVRRLALRT
jgi:hypothetical protein